MTQHVLIPDDPEVLDPVLRHLEPFTGTYEVESDQQAIHERLMATGEHAQGVPDWTIGIPAEADEESAVEQQAAAVYVSPFGLTQKQRMGARAAQIRSQRVALAHRGVMVYSEGSARWSGIDEMKRGWRGQYPPVADCSSDASWGGWDGWRFLVRLGKFQAYAAGDLMNGASWRAGYTGTLVLHGVAVAEAQLISGDLVFYGGTLSVPQHVTTYVGNGLVISHGRPGDPTLLPVNLNGALSIIGCRRYIR